MRSFTRHALAVLAACTVCATPVLAGSSPKDVKAKAAEVKAAGVKAGAEVKNIKTDAAHDAMAEQMAKLAAAGPQHEVFKSMVGSWKAEVKSWFAPGDPVVSQGSCENRLVLGGRFLEERYTGTMMDQPFEGYGLFGYDNQKQMYTSHWFDTMSTGAMFMSGPTPSEGAEMVMTGMMDGPDGKPMPVRSVTKIVSPDKHVFTMYAKMGEQEAPMMEITYSRAQMAGGR